MTVKKLRMLSLFAGIGGAEIAAHWTGGIEVVGQVENNSHALAVLGKQFPYVPRMGDIREVVGNEFGTIDIVMVALPCQPFSNAGKRLGEDDDRYLWPEALRIIKACRPRWIIIENVAGFISLALDLVCADLEAEGYEVQPFIIPACAVGAPHERKRLFAVAHLAVR